MPNNVLSTTIYSVLLNNSHITSELSCVFSVKAGGAIVPDNVFNTTISSTAKLYPWHFGTHSDNCESRWCKYQYWFQHQHPILNYTHNTLEHSCVFRAKTGGAYTKYLFWHHHTQYYNISPTALEISKVRLLNYTLRTLKAHVFSMLMCVVLVPNIAWSKHHHLQCYLIASTAFQNTNNS